MAKYVFPGLWTFIERAAKGSKLALPDRTREPWHCKQINEVLGQLPRLDRASQRHLLEHVLKVRDSLAVMLKGIDMAIGEVSSETGLPLPENFGGP